MEMTRRKSMMSPSPTDNGELFRGSDRTFGQILKQTLSECGNGGVDESSGVAMQF